MSSPAQTPKQLVDDVSPNIGGIGQLLTYICMYQQSGWIPSFPSVSRDQAVMIGHHADQLILDTYAKGYRNFDVEAAYAGMRKNATEATLLPWSHASLTPLDKIYFEKGFFPALAWEKTRPSLK